MSAAGTVFGAIGKPDNEFPIFDGAQLHNVPCLHDSGAMDAKKIRRVEPLLQRSHGFAQQVSAAVRVQLRIIPGSSNPFHIVGLNNLYQGSRTAPLLNSGLRRRRRIRTHRSRAILM